jgi:serine/threonine protein kinase
MTPFYASLEQLNEEEAQPSFDIWSLGIILYTLMAKKEPYTQIGILKRIEAIKNNERESLSMTYSKELRELVDLCLTLDQINRPNIEKILRYPLIRVELDKIFNYMIPLTYNYPTALSAHLVLE